ncbi:unnamed protein product [Microthlaspi erraticum]|uniref:Uncharacterized protein n=1 Tax=Microthlaspi erraticum TaxID=1685480 RepID=A0A6D2L274_9BRAS|nr:unnamed protein product [Microthlaspi erraticum]
MRAMLPYFSNKWELRGTAEGSDLGNGCFQFRFDYEDDLRKVLENRPYQYSRSPSGSPKEVSQRGLPLHYWKQELLLSIGEKIGHLTSYKLTSSAAKIKIEVNGLEPITKEAIVEFEGGSETLVTLEYHRLDKHCLYCFKLTHEENDCAENPNSTLLPSTERQPPPLRPNHLKPPFFSNTEDLRLDLPHSTRHHRREAISTQRPCRDQSPLHSRSLRAPRRSSDLHTSYRTNLSLPYRLERRENPRQPPPITNNFTPNSRRVTPLERNLDHDYFPPSQRLQTEDEILQDLQDVDIRYINCGDPTESAAQRQRILESDNNGLLTDMVAFLYNAPSNLVPATMETNLAHQESPSLLQPPERGTNRRADPIGETEEGLTLATPAKRRGRPPSKAANPNSTNQPAEGTSKRKTKTQLRSPLLRISPLSRVIQNRTTQVPKLTRSKTAYGFRTTPEQSPTTFKDSPGKTERWSGFSTPSKSSSLAVLSWNCCWLGNLMTVHRVKELIKTHAPDIIYLMETKNFEEFIAKHLPLSEYMAQDSWSHLIAPVEVA